MSSVVYIIPFNVCCNEVRVLGGHWSPSVCEEVGVCGKGDELGLLNILGVGTDPPSEGGGFPGGRFIGGGVVPGGGGGVVPGGGGGGVVPGGGGGVVPGGGGVLGAITVGEGVSPPESLHKKYHSKKPTTASTTTETSPIQNHLFDFGFCSGITIIC